MLLLRASLSTITFLTGVFFMNCAAPLRSYAQDWEWLRTGGPDRGTNPANAVITDSEGNVLVTGSFIADADFNGITLSSAGDQDVFVAKYTSSGTILWAKRFGGTKTDIGHGIAVDAAGNSYITGQFTGDFTVAGSTLTSVGDNAFLIKLDPNGNPLWARQAGGWHGQGLAIVANAAGRTWMGGFCSGPLVVGSIEISHNPDLSFDGFVASYDTDGNALWADRMTGEFTDHVHGLALDANGNLLVAGRYLGEISTGSLSVQTGGNDYGGFLLKYNSAGTPQWLVSTSGAGYVSARAVAVNASGQAFVTGEFYRTISFGSSTLTATGPNDALRDFWVGKVDTDGTILWAINGGGDQWDEALAIAVDANGDAYITGYVDQSGAFGDLTYTLNRTVPFVSKVSGDGVPQWIRLPGDSTTGRGLGITVDASGTLYHTGFVSRGLMPVQFGSHTSDIPNFTNHMFVARLNPTGSGNAGILALFPSAQQSPNDPAWYQVEWFGIGWFSADTFPWIHHLNHGWLWCTGSADAIYLYDDILGWLFTSPYFPNQYYQYSRATWLQHASGSTKYATGRWFYNLSLADWENVDQEG